MSFDPEGAAELDSQPGRGGAQGELLVDGEVGVVMLGVLGWAFGHFELR